MNRLITQLKVLEFQNKEVFTENFQGFLENTWRTSNDSKGITICKGNTRRGYLGALVEGEGYFACVEQGVIIMLKFIKIGYEQNGKVNWWKKQKLKHVINDVTCQQNKL